MTEKVLSLLEQIQQNVAVPQLPDIVLPKSVSDPSGGWRQRDALLAKHPLAAEWFLTKAPFHFIAESRDFPSILAKQPTFLTEQAAQGVDQFCITADMIQSNLVKIEIEDPKFLDPLETPVWTDEQILELQTISETTRLAAEQRLVRETYATRESLGLPCFQGVSVVLRFKAIINTTTKQLVPMRAGAPGQRQALAADEAWLGGHRSLKTELRAEAVDAGLLTLEDFRFLHLYAALCNLLDEINGPDARYQRSDDPEAKGGSSVRQQLSVADASKAIFQFQLQRRRVPKGTANPDDNPDIQAAGMVACTWQGLKVTGNMTAGQVENATDYHVVEQKAADVTLPADIFALEATPDAEVMGAPAGTRSSF